MSGNRIVDNFAGKGGGVLVFFASPTINGNEIKNNETFQVNGGAGVLVQGASVTEITGNVIADNDARSYSGGGIGLLAAGYPIIRDNIIKNNSAGIGGGINTGNCCDALIVQNLIFGNTASRGGGLHLQYAATLVANTIADNDAPTSGSAILMEGLGETTMLLNNQIIGLPGQEAITCGFFRPVPPNPPILEYNNVFTFGYPAYDATCEDQTGINGNISEDPLFADPSNGDYRLQLASPSIDAGDNTASDLPVADLDGNPRVFDGDDDGVAVVDIGAYEFGSHPPVPDLINDLIELVASQGFNPGTENPLLDKLNAALHVFEIGNSHAAANILGDFIDIVEAKREKTISDDQANELIAAAERIISILETY